MHPSSSDFLNKDINSLQPGAHGFDAIAATAAAAGPSIKGFPSGIRHYQTIRDVSNERPSSLRNLDGVAVPGRESNVLFVDKLPNDCTRREVGQVPLANKNTRIGHIACCQSRLGGFAPSTPEPIEKSSLNGGDDDAFGSKTDDRMTTSQ
nr:hypothetical protein CFP56_10700 [Quercus suber]